MRRRTTLSVELLEDRRLPSATLVQDILAGPGSGTPRHLVNLNGTLFFTAADSEHGAELWTSDGTAKGTVLVKDINPGPRGSAPLSLTVAGDRVFFVANYDLQESTAELWVSDGTEKGTARVRDFSPGEPACILLDQLTAFNGSLAFRHGWYPSGQFCEKGPSTLDFTLWVSDGTEEGTVSVATVKNLNEPTAVGDTLFFGGYNAADRREQLWRSDGTADGTALVTELDIGGQVTRPRRLTDVGGRLFFVSGTALAESLWVSDGTEKGTARILETRAGLQNLTVVWDTLFFTAPHPDLGIELWRSDGTEKGTFVVRDIRPDGNSVPAGLTNVAGTLMFSADDGKNGRELWRSDGTEKGTQMVRDIAPGAAGAFASTSQLAFLATEWALYFSADDGKYGRELWQSDGTEEGTFLVEDINPGAAGSLWTLSARPFLTAVGDRVFFAANDGKHGVELWATAGSDQPGPDHGQTVDLLLAELLAPRRRTRLPGLVLLP